MYFHKHPYPANFKFATRCFDGMVDVGEQRLRLQTESFVGGIHRVTLSDPNLWAASCSQAGLTPPPVEAEETGKRRSPRSRLDVDPEFGLRLVAADGQTLLSAPAGNSFGLCGKASLFMFEHDPAFEFYGMGEKQKGLELSHVRTKFWNTDVWGDFDSNVFINGHPDPMYVSVPYLIVKRGNRYVGLLLDNPMATFMSTAPIAITAGAPAAREEARKNCFWIGCEDGQPDLYIIVGPSLAELTRKLQCLVGCTPLPPAWALGYHQCRWGYESLADMEYLDANFRRFQIPCDAFWFDIEYMDGYRVFTWDKSKFPDQRRAFEDLRRRGRRIVPILDPGVKREAGYAVYDDGRKADIFCKNPTGREFVGLVWPGETAFPDFSTEAGRAWWAKWVRSFAETGVSGAWLDMNDPSTGHVDSSQMLFDNGRRTHETFHNQYAMGMARASRDGFLAANPDARPFLLCRSGCTGSSRYTAIWTGDNYSNWHHLRGSIAMTLNLALSGIPFNGPDVPGFGGDVTRPLMLAWIKAACLFPVLRNHSMRGAVRQEPWVFDNDALEVIREYIRLRYKFRPYLYNLFAAQELTGEAILRPLFHDFDDTPALPLGKIDDQFMVGPAVMQAPLVSPESHRTVALPPGRWFSLLDGRWMDGGSRLEVRDIPSAKSPIYLRGGSIVPMAAGAIGDDTMFHSRQVEFHVVVDGQTGEAACEYVFDDGESFAYRTGARSRLKVSATANGRALDLRTELADAGFGECSAVFILYAEFETVRLNGQEVSQHRVDMKLAGTAMTLWQVGGGATDRVKNAANRARERQGRS